MRRSVLILGLFIAMIPLTGQRQLDEFLQGKSMAAKHMQQVENGLLPVVVIKGDKVLPMTLTDRMRYYKVPAVSIAMINNGQIEWARGYGIVEAGGKRPVTMTTLFQAASISKPVAALAALSLVQEGRLDLDEDVNIKLTSWKIPANENTKNRKVTLRGLLTHSAGMTVSGFPGYTTDAQIPTLIQILEGRPPANTPAIRVDMPPRTKWRYSGGGITVMQQLLIDVSGQTFPDLLNEVVFKKLGMEQSTYQQPLPTHLKADAATGYRADGKPVRGKWHIYPEMAAAGLWTTASDLARFGIELQKSKIGEANNVLSVALAEQMLTPQLSDSVTQSKNPRVSTNNWGLGIWLDGQRGTAVFGHDGANEGFRNKLRVYADTGQGVAIMTNSDNGEYLINELLLSIAKTYGWPNMAPKEKAVAKVDPSLYDLYAGEYEVSPGYLIRITNEDGRLFQQISRQDTAMLKLELYPESAVEYFMLESDLEVTFVKDGTGLVKEMTLGNQTARKIR